MNIESNIKAFVRLGGILRCFADEAGNSGENSCVFKYEDYYNILNNAINLSYAGNPWFTPEFVKYSLKVWGDVLKEENLRKWLDPYTSSINLRQRELKAAVVMPGNLPLAGFHDFLCVLITGNVFKGKLSSKDKYLLPAIAEILKKEDTGFDDRIMFSFSSLSDFDFVIATGSGNTSRYFEYYFGKYPNIIRKNRSSIAVLKGDETLEELRVLAKDIFLYFGLGCRSVSKIYVPAKYDFVRLIGCFDEYSYVCNHSKYMNNYDYCKAIYLVNKDKFLDNGFILLKEDGRLASPVSVLFYEYYESLTQLAEFIEASENQIQCVCSGSNVDINKSIRLGKAQEPDLWDYADGVDTIKFILGL